MKILVLCSNYPDLGGKTGGMFFHVRNLYYKDNGTNVHVLNFSANQNYTKDGIDVFSFTHFENKLVNEEYDILLCHAPHISHHYRFLMKYSKMFKNIVFIFHGNEVFKTKVILPKEYSFMNNNKLYSTLRRNIKDEVKLHLWRKLFEKLAYKSQFVFVSNWMREQFYKFTKINRDILNGRNHVIYNSIGKPFEENKYDKNKSKKYDFITIRNNLDGAKYGIDIVNNLAKSNANYKFLVIGKGEFFKYYDKAPNIELIQKELSHEEILNYLNESRFGLLPTLWDSQGLMTCEFASFGIPTITSDIEICHEILGDFNNVEFIENEEVNLDLTNIVKKLQSKTINDRNVKYYAANTSGKELELFKKILT
ncbi:glycosyltransferase [Marinilactibacillus psychrotolerans]|nr:glycosyltransferase [Marinilactibacillus psychrotolerans]